MTQSNRNTGALGRKEKRPESLYSRSLGGVEICCQNSITSNSVKASETCAGPSGDSLQISIEKVKCVTIPTLTCAGALQQSQCEFLRLSKQKMDAHNGKMPCPRSFSRLRVEAAPEPIIIGFLRRLSQLVTSWNRT